MLPKADTHTLRQLSDGSGVVTNALTLIKIDCLPAINFLFEHAIQNAA